MYNNPMEKLNFEILEKFYKRLHDNVLREEKKLEKNSILITLIKIKSSKTSKYLNDSSIKEHLFNIDAIKELKEEMCLRTSDHKNKLDESILTSKGIYKVENIKNVLNLNKLLDFFQKKYFSFSDIKQPLSDIEKIILLTMIGVRNFSLESPMNLKSKHIQDYWLEIFKKTFKFLTQLKIIKKKDLTFEKQGNEHPVSYAMRRTNSLQKKTQHIFISKGHKKYYLDIAEDKNISTPKLKRVFKLIFGKIINENNINEIIAYCNDIAYKRAKYVKDDFKFIESKYDILIKNTIKEIYLE
ncbi:MAG: hypothetical protein ACTSUT_13665 [Promethearchaeota archaeon]